jgi:hypothetical protein
MVLQRRAKIGLNRGKARLWLEGQWLADAGFAVGTKFTMTITRVRSQNYIHLRAQPDGDRKVSGKGTKPIIDINTDILRTLAPAGDYIRLNVSQGSIVGVQIHNQAAA